MAARWVTEFEDGIRPRSAARNYQDWREFRPAFRNSMPSSIKAAASLISRQGLTIASHTGDGVAAMAQISTLKAHGVSPVSFIWVQPKMKRNTRLHLRAAEAGAWVEFDGISSAAAQKHVELVLGMKQAGYLSRVLLSQDSGWYHVGEPGGGNFRPYDFLLIEFLPCSCGPEFLQRKSRTLMIRNPRAVLTVPK